MVNFYMTVGLPASGKSTWAQQNKGKIFDEVFSSDEYREKLLGDVNDQSKNGLVFDTMNNDVINSLKSGKNVCYDATNINRKDRSRILNLINDKKINCYKKAVIFVTPLDEIYKRNSSRDRSVPNYAIDKMIRRFEIPFIGEGFDEIIEERVVLSTKIIENNLKKLVSQCINFDQDNPHHNHDLYMHCSVCCGNLSDETDNSSLLTASLYHDIGKLFTKEYDENKGYSHFIGHENYGAYLILTYINYNVAFYVNYHMEPYRLAKAKPEKAEKYIKQFGKEWDNILLLHKADENAH